MQHNPVTLDAVFRHISVRTHPSATPGCVSVLVYPWIVTSMDTPPALIRDAWRLWLHFYVYYLETHGFILPPSELSRAIQSGPPASYDPVAFTAVPGVKTQQPPPPTQQAQTQTEAPLPPSLTTPRYHGRPVPGPALEAAATETPVD